MVHILVGLVEVEAAFPTVDWDLSDSDTYCISIVCFFFLFSCSMVNSNPGEVHSGWLTMYERGISR